MWREVSDFRERERGLERESVFVFAPFHLLQKCGGTVWVGVSQSSLWSCRGHGMKPLQSSIGALCSEIFDLLLQILRNPNFWFGFFCAIFWWVALGLVYPDKDFLGLVCLLKSLIFSWFWGAYCEFYWESELGRSWSVENVSSFALDFWVHHPFLGPSVCSVSQCCFFIRACWFLCFPLVPQFTVSLSLSGMLCSIILCLLFNATFFFWKGKKFSFLLKFQNFRLFKFDDNFNVVKKKWKNSCCLRANRKSFVGFLNLHFDSTQLLHFACAVWCLHCSM